MADSFFCCAGFFKAATGALARLPIGKECSLSFFISPFAALIAS
jgi:hypothetical protein